MAGLNTGNGPDLAASLVTRRQVLRWSIAIGCSVGGAAILRAARAAVPKPRLVMPAEWGAQPPQGTFRAHRLTRITLHHEGEFFDGSIPAPRYLRRIQRFAIEERRWPDIPYHYLVDLAGTIYAGRPITAVGDTSTKYDPRGHALISVLGDYDRQRPRRAQLEAIGTLMAWLASTYSIPITRIAAHRDFVPTRCPGKHLYAVLENGTLLRDVRRRLRQT